MVATMNMRLLGITTSQHEVGVALLEEGQVVWEQVDVGGGKASAQLPVLAERVTREAQLPEGLQGIVVVNGPGGYTSLRIGVSFAKTLAQTWRVPVVGLSTLEGLACQSVDATAATLTLLSACRDEWNVALFAAKEVTTSLVETTSSSPCVMRLPRRLTPDFVLSQEAIVRFLSRVRGPLIVHSTPAIDWYHGVGIAPSEASWRQVHLPHAYPLPSDVARLGAARFVKGDADDLGSLLPLYSHPPNITVPRL